MGKNMRGFPRSVPARAGVRGGGSLSPRRSCLPSLHTHRVRVMFRALDRHYFIQTPPQPGGDTIINLRVLMGKRRRGECVACPGPTARIRQRDESLAATLPESRLLASASLVFIFLAPLSVEIVGKGRQHLRGDTAIKKSAGDPNHFYPHSLR